MEQQRPLSTVTMAFTVVAFLIFVTARSHVAGMDLPLWPRLLCALAMLLLVAAIWLTTPLHEKFDWVPDLKMNPLGAGLIVLFGFLFVTVSSRLTGEIGSSSNPISASMKSSP